MVFLEFFVTVLEFIVGLILYFPLLIIISIGEIFIAWLTKPRE